MPSDSLITSFTLGFRRPVFLIGQYRLLLFAIAVTFSIKLPMGIIASGYGPESAVPDALPNLPIEMLGFHFIPSFDFTVIGFSLGKIRWGVADE